MTEPKKLRRISSYGRNRGRKLGEVRGRLEQELLPQLLLDASKPDLSAFEHWQLEIGFGSGEHLAMQAAKHPHMGFIGCEPYITAATILLRQIEEQNLTNIRLYNGDARDLIEHLPNASINKAFILFPDPWPKLRHHKRRLVNHRMLDDLHRILISESELLIATDHEGYLNWILEHMLARPDFAWQATQASDWLEPPSDWVTTKYQAKALREGRVPHWLAYITTPAKAGDHASRSQAIYGS